MLEAIIRNYLIDGNRLLYCVCDYNLAVKTQLCIEGIMNCTLTALLNPYWKLNASVFTRKRVIKRILHIIAYIHMGVSLKQT